MLTRFDPDAVAKQEADLSHKRGQAGKHEPQEESHPDSPSRGRACLTLEPAGYWSHSWTLSSLSFTQSAPASSGSCLSPAIAFATSS